MFDRICCKLKNMEKIISLVTLLLLLSIHGQAQEANSWMNLDLETVENGLPFNWHGINYGDTINYTVSVDSFIVNSGKYAASVEFTGDKLGSKSLAFYLLNYEGKKITLSGYIKTENITEGYAGINWSIIDKNQYRIALDNGTCITGTTDWKKYEVTLDLHPADTKYITIEVKLLGNGKMWLDDFTITIDGKDVHQLTPYEPKPFPAESDKEFDDGSRIALAQLSNQNIKDLELLGRVWGFLKYHHPAIAQGNYNWDYELFRILPDYLKTNHETQRDELLLNWIDKLGDIPECEINETPADEIYLKPDLSWMENSNINRELKERLQHVYKNRHQGRHYYVLLRSTGNPIFLHESDYADMPYPDAGFRLLALYRYWNTIYYFFPSKYLTDKDWNDVLGEYILNFVEAKNELEYELTAMRIIGDICDSHAENMLAGSNEINQLRGFRCAPFKARFVENQLIVTDYYNLADAELSKEEVEKKTGLSTGDIITHINGKSVEAIIDSLRIYYPSSNDARKKKNMTFDLLRSNEKTLRIDYVTSSGLKEQRDIDNGYHLKLYEQDTVMYYRHLGKGNDIGYLKMVSLMRDEDIFTIKREFGESQGIIFDIRGTPYETGRMLASWFIASEVPVAKQTRGNPDNPGEFVFNSKEYIRPSLGMYAGKLVVLVNEETQSEGEFQTMMFRAGQNTTVIGSQTAGADGRVSDVLLPGGIKTWISGLGVYYPDGRQTQRIGIIPDIEVKPTIKGIREGRDELLERAIEIIEKE